MYRETSTSTVVVVVAATATAVQKITHVIFPLCHIYSDENDTPSFVSQVPGNSAHVVESDILAWNGIMHIVDAVLIPTSLTLNLMQVTYNDPELDTLLAMIASAGLEDSEFFTSSAAFTILAPTNDAFTALTDETTQLVTSDPDLLSSILMFHVLTDVYPVESMTDGMEIVTTQGSSVTVSISDNGNDNVVATLNGMAQIIQADQIASNGLIHKLNAVLFPPPSSFDESGHDDGDDDDDSEVLGTAAPSSALNTTNTTTSTDAPTSIATTIAPSPPLNLLEIAATRSDLTTFIGLITVAGIDLASLESSTLLLAPTEEAFTALGEETYMELVLPENSAQLLDILTYHIYPETTIPLSNGQILTSMEGSTTTVDILLDDTNATTTIGFNNFNAKAIETDIIASNGVIYMVDAVLLPPSARS